MFIKMKKHKWWWGWSSASDDSQHVCVCIICWHSHDKIVGRCKSDAFFFWLYFMCVCAWCALRFILLAPPACCVIDKRRYAWYIVIRDANFWVYHQQQQQQNSTAEKNFTIAHPGGFWNLRFCTRKQDRWHFVRSLSPSSFMICTLFCCIFFAQFVPYILPPLKLLLRLKLAIWNAFIFITIIN